MECNAFENRGQQPYHLYQLGHQMEISVYLFIFILSLHNLLKEFTFVFFLPLPPSPSSCNSDRHYSLKSSPNKWVKTGVGKELASFRLFHYRHQNLPKLTPLLSGLSLATVVPVVSVVFCFDFSETFIRA